MVTLRSSIGMIDKTDQLINIHTVERANGKLYVTVRGLVLPEFELQDPNITRAFEVKNYEIDKTRGKYLLTLTFHDDVDKDVLVSTYYEDYQKLGV
jgi:hypothetical protein